MGDSVPTQTAQGSKFLFVSGPKATATKEARRHVAKGSYNVRNRRTKTGISAYLSLPLVWRARPGSDAAVCSSGSNVVVAPQRTRHSQDTGDDDDSLEEFDQYTTHDHHREAAEGADRSQTGMILASRSRAVQPLALVGNGHSDPFGASCVPIDTSIHQLLCYSRDYYVLAKWPGERDFDENASAVSFWKRDMKDSITSQGAFYAALAVAIQFMANIETQPQRRSELIRQSLHQKSRALATIRQSLQRGAFDQNTISAILDLTGADGYGGSHDHFSMHMAAVKDVLNHLGGIRAVDDEIRIWIGVIDSSGSFISFIRPTFPVEEWDLGSWSQQSLSHIYSLEPSESWPFLDADVVALGLWALPFPFLKKTLESLYEIVAVMKLVTTISFRQHRNHIYKWVTVRRSAIKAYCLTNYFDIMDSDPGGALHTPDFRCITAAAVFQVGLCLQGLVIYPSATVLVHGPTQLIQAIKAALSDDETQGLGCRPMLNLWLSFGGFVIEELSGQLSQDGSRGTFAAKFREIVTQLQLESWRQAGSILRIFLYDDALDKYLEPLFREITAKEYQMPTYISG